jgi:hypothetical protein
LMLEERTMRCRFDQFLCHTISTINVNHSGQYLSVDYDIVALSMD